MRSIDPERLVSGLAIGAYAAVTLVALWMAAQGYARDPFPDEPTGFIVFLAVVVFVVPLLAGFAIGRWSACALVLWLILATTAVAGLAPPIWRDPTGEVEGGIELVALTCGLFHFPLLLAGIGLRKLIRPRRPAEPWRLKGNLVRRRPPGAGS